MRDILDALESIHTNKKKPMDIKKEMNKKPAVMKALSLEDTEVLEGTEMGQIGDVHIKQFGMAKGQLGIQLTSDQGEGYAQMSKEDAKAMAERLLQWANSSEPAMPGEYESKESVEEGSAGGWSMGKVESYLDYIDQLTQKMSDTKLAYQIQNAADDIRKALELDPTNVRTAFESLREEFNKDYDVLHSVEDTLLKLYNFESGDDAIDVAVEEARGILADLKARLEGDYASFDESTKEEQVEEQVEEDCSCETELTNSEEQKMETNQKDTVEVAVEDLARVLELAGLGKEIVKAEAQAEAQAENEVELDEYSNSPDEDYFDADTQLNKMSGGLNGPKAQHKKEYPGDNPLAVELEQKLAKILADM